MIDKEEIEAFYKNFSTPLVYYQQLGGGKEATRSLAQNLWAVFLAGPAAEAEFWTKLTTAGGLDAALAASLRVCYEEEMKPRVSALQLETLRKHYGIAAP